MLLGKGTKPITKIEKIIFCVGNDFLNSDNVNNTTTKGTPQDNMNSWFEIINKATQLIINGIDMLRTMAPVDVINVVSNHDMHSMYGIMNTLSAYYRNIDDITIDTSPLAMKHILIGKTLVTLSHNMNVKDALANITKEAKDMWAKADRAILILAHLHQEMKYKQQGMLEIMRLPTFSGWSRWGSMNQYTSSDFRGKCLLMDKKYGIKDELTTFVE